MRSRGSTKVAREFWILVVLVMVLAVEVLSFVLTHRDVEELSRDADSATPLERVDALHILLNRDLPSTTLETANIHRILGSDEPLVRELAMTSDVWRLAGRKSQKQYLRTLASNDEAVRGRYYLKTHGRPFRRQELRTYFRSLEQEEP